MCIIIEMYGLGSKYTCEKGAIIIMVANIIIKATHTWTCDFDCIDHYCLYVLYKDVIWIVMYMVV